MNEIKLQRQIEEMKREIEATGAIAEKRAVELRADIDRLKLEVIALKELIKAEFPELAERFSGILEETLKRVSPE